MCVVRRVELSVAGLVAVPAAHIGEHDLLDALLQNTGQTAEQHRYPVFPVRIFDLDLNRWLIRLQLPMAYRYRCFPDS